MRSFGRRLGLDIRIEVHFDAGVALGVAGPSAVISTIPSTHARITSSCARVRAEATGALLGLGVALGMGAGRKVGVLGGMHVD